MPRLYTWDQTPSEVRIFVPVEGDFDYKRDVKFVAKGGRHVTLSVGPKTYMDGRLFAQVDQDMAEYACSTHEEGGVKLGRWLDTLTLSQAWARLHADMGSNVASIAF